MRKNNIKLSFIVPMYNVEKYICECISSLYRQGLNEEDFEVIIVNDGSTDSSMETIMPIANSHKNITIINQTNKGLSASRNAGLSKASGTYVSFIDSDDIIIDNSVSILLKQALESNVDTIKGGVIKIKDSDIPQQGIQLPLPTPSLIIKKGEQAYCEDYDRNESYAPQNLYKKEFLNKESLTFLTGMTFEDVAFYSEMCLKAKTFAISNIPFYIYRQRVGSIMSTMNKDKLISMNMVIEHIYKITGKIPFASNTKKHIIDNMFCSVISVNYWYVTHYKSIYPYWREILYDLKQRIPLSTFNKTWKQCAITACLKYIPHFYLWARYKLNSKKYE